jgi:hypothetical protein
VSSSLLSEIVAFLHAAESINKKVPTNLVIFSFIDIFVSKMIPKSAFFYEKII